MHTWRLIIYKINTIDAAMSIANQRCKNGINKKKKTSLQSGHDKEMMINFDYVLRTTNFLAKF